MARKLPVAVGCGWSVLSLDTVEFSSRRAPLHNPCSRQESVVGRAQSVDYTRAVDWDGAWHLDVIHRLGSLGSAVLPVEMILLS